MKRKSKLFLSLASMMFAVALLCFGVYAALSVTYTISGSVVYEVKDVFVNIQTSVYVSTLGTLTDETQLRTNMTKLQNFEEVTNIADTGYTHSFNTYENGDITQQGDVTSGAEDIPINYGTYQANTQGFAYYIVVNIKNYGTEQVGVNVQNNINAQNINSKVAVTKSTNIDARGDSAFAEKNIVIALALDDATKSVSNVEFNVPITISRTLVQEQTYGTISNSQGTYNIGSDDQVTFTSEVIDATSMDMGYLSFYNFTLNDIPPNTNWLNLQINGDFDVGYIAKGQYTDVNDFVTNGMANVIGMICGNASTAIKVTDLVSGEDKTFTVMLGYMDNKPSKSSLTLGWSELKENMQTQDFVQISTTYWGIGMLDFYNQNGLIYDDPTEFINNFKNKTSVKIPSEITTIGYSAFEGCSNLQSVDLSNCTNLTTIGINAFDDCSSLKSVDLSACTKLTTIGDSAFSSCSNLQSVDLSNCTKLTTIEDHAFYNCRSLSEITIPQSVTTIGNGAFIGCRSLSEITIPQSVTTIGNGAFIGCSSLNTVVIDTLVIANAIADSSSQGFLLNFLQSGTGVVKVKCKSLDELDEIESTSYLKSSNFNQPTEIVDGYALFTKK